MILVAKLLPFLVVDLTHPLDLQPQMSLFGFWQRFCIFNFLSPLRMSSLHPFIGSERLFPKYKQVFLFMYFCMDHTCLLFTCMPYLPFRLDISKRLIIIVKKRGRDWLSCSGYFVCVCMCARITRQRERERARKQSYVYDQLFLNKLQRVGLNTN